jgi:ATP-dependent helicase HrpA
MTTWDIDDLPAVVDTRVAGGVIRGYPALLDDGTSVSARIEATPAQAETATRSGVRRLVLLSTPSPAEYVLDHLTATEKLALATSPYPSARAAVEDCRVAVADAVITRVQPGGVVRTRAEFERVQDAFADAVVDELFATVSLLARILTAAREVERAVKATNALTLLSALGDVKGQLAGLVFPGFVSRTGTARLGHLPRYLQGALVRLSALPDNPGRDRQRQTEFEHAAGLYAEAGGRIPLPPDAPERLVEVRWMLEEYRISLFAQNLGTASSVSLPRISRTLGGT